MKLTIRVWRQPSSDRAGFFEEHVLEGADAKMSVLELLDALNERLSEQGLAPVAFDSDCREGVCGACGLLVDGRPNGNGDNLPACHQRIGTRREGGTLTIEPFRSAVMPVVKDLVVDRCALDFLQGEAGASAAATGRAPDADAVPVARDAAERALDFGACIGCGSCVAACPNGSAALYAGARLASLALAPVPAKQRRERARAMARALEIFGPCSGYGECALACPAKIPLAVTGFVARERWGALFAGEDGR